jgi:hypothetical protein
MALCMPANECADVDEEESIMDEEDLDRMAGGAAAGSAGPSGAAAREPTPETQLKVVRAVLNCVVLL